MSEREGEFIATNQKILKDIWKRQDLKEMALQVIDNLCIAIEDGMDKDKALDLIYQFSHCASETICSASHMSWRKELKEYYKNNLLTPER